MKIDINEPCHENWDAMTPNKQGAFCKSCVKDVVDFSKKSLEEIKDFFSKPQQGKICGRFEEKQLQELSFDDFFAKFRYWNFGKKFAVIFFMSFGFWIFSNSSAMAQAHHKQGLVAVFEEAVQKDTTKKITGQPVIKEEPVLMGKIKCIKPDPAVKQPVIKKQPENKPYKQNTLEDKTKSVSKQEGKNVKGKKIEKPLNKKETPMIMGDFAMPVPDKQSIEVPKEKIE